jgi:hypothetical protein
VATYQSSRWSTGNRLFPDRISLNADAVVFHKRHLIGGEEETIRYEQIASVSIQRGFFLADVLFETTGGTEPVFLNGLWIGAAERCKADVMSRVGTHTTKKEDKVVALLEDQNRILSSILEQLKQKV